MRCRGMGTECEPSPAGQPPRVAIPGVNIEAHHRCQMPDEDRASATKRVEESLPKRTGDGAVVKLLSSLDRGRPVLYRPNRGNGGMP